MNRTLLRGATIVSMAPGRPDAERADLLIEDGRLTQIGEQLDSAGADLVDLTGRVVIPGLVNAHLHTWQTGLRAVGTNWTLMQYLGHMHGGGAESFRPDDLHIATLAGALNQIDCGTTTLGDWCHNSLTPEHADAGVAGLALSGVRAVFFHGTPYRDPEEPHPITEIDRLLHGPIEAAPLLALGMAVQGPQYCYPDTAVADLRAAAERGLVASFHQSGGEPEGGWEAVRDAGLFGPLVNIVHGSDMPDEWVKALVDAGATFTSTPENELGQGHGTPVIDALLRQGAAPSLGTDVDSVAPGTLFTAARLALAHQRGLDHARHLEIGMPALMNTVKAKHALAWATVEGAKALGLDDQVGHLAAGMQADLVVIDARALNLWPAHDPIAAALHADIANIEAVMIAGHWRKRDHRLLHSGLDDIKDRLRASGERLVRTVSEE